MGILASSLLIVTLILFGSQSISAVTYTHWGQTSCPTDSTGATLVYEGMTAGSKHSESGGGAQYICLPKEPEYWSVGVGTPRTESFLYGAEYQLRLYPSQVEYTAPCAVCLASNKSSVIMIPAKITCPRSWTLEYNGYLIAEYYAHPNNVLYECLDVNVETVPGTSQRDPEASIHHVTSTCHGLPCPPYRTTKELACAVCSK
ncbi:PREDICTED: short-chain collagen C4-like [Amphimedon queenslandica]|uniref:Chitin-binding type-4 domain-containing protein n=1 Tax=Amphimedon queenslandica TaxID=400682 RepID=A0A1X7SK87_AMPQE|nr:PREDICTED: short-chain collagen C4-like [Amphimedon queenslandica]|eukprot:XP_003391950.1 PREDICTED: short-chain collagen C4-like [Amphimedon queenslandica]